MKLFQKRRFMPFHLLSSAIVGVFLCLAASGAVFAEDIQLNDATGSTGSEVSFVISVENAPNDVSSLGLDLLFCADVLEFKAVDFSNTLLENYDFKQGNNPQDGLIRIGAFEAGGDGIVQGASGVLAKVSFTVVGDQDCALNFTGLKDDIASWSSVGGQLVIAVFGIEPTTSKKCVGASVEFSIVPDGFGAAPFYWAVDGTVQQEGDDRSFEFRPNSAGLYTITVADSSSPVLAAQVTAEFVDEQESGDLDVLPARAGLGEQTVVALQVNNAPNSVAALGVDFLYDSDVLAFSHAEFDGTLLEGFDQKGVSNPEPGFLRIGGFTTVDEIEQGATGELVRLVFDVADDFEGCVNLFLEVDALKDDIAAWSSSNGCFFANCGCNGDVNGDGSITAMDALCAFEKYSMICPTSCGIPCEDVCGDVDRNGETSPADALCIFRKYLMLPSCLD